MIHGEEGLRSARKASEVLFGGEIEGFSDRELADIFNDVPSSTIPRDELAAGIGVLNLFSRSGLTRSNSEALQMAKQGGLYVNNHRVEDSRGRVTVSDLASESMLVLRCGKKKYHLVRVTG